jgi:hypothetical protein
MSLYRKIHSSFWTSGTGKRLRGHPTDQLVALYLMTNPHSHMIGIYHCPVLFIAHETGIPMEGVIASIERLSDGSCMRLGSPLQAPSKGDQRGVSDRFLSYDWEEEFVLVHRMAFFQVGGQLSPKDNQVKGIKNAIDTVPNIPLKRIFLEEYADFYLLHEVLAALPEYKPLVSPFAAPPKPEAVTEAETVTVTEAETALVRKPKTQTRFAEFWAAYPKAVGKKDALRIWQNKNLDSIADQVIADVENRTANHRPWVEGFVHNPSTYLNGERWTDAIERRGAPNADKLSPYGDFEKRDYSVGINPDGSF